MVPHQCTAKSMLCWQLHTNCSFPKGCIVYHNIFMTLSEGSLPWRLPQLPGRYCQMYFSKPYFSLSVNCISQRARWSESEVGEALLRLSRSPPAGGGLSAAGSSPKSPRVEARKARRPEKRERSAQSAQGPRAANIACAARISVISTGYLCSPETKKCYQTDRFDL